MKYSNYTTQQFLEDPYFRQWVQNPDAELDTFWLAFQHDNPEKIHNLIHARELMWAIEGQVESDFPSQLQEDSTFELIRNELKTNKKIPFAIPIWVRWAVAASLILVTIWWVVWPLQSKKVMSYESLKESEKETLTEKINKTTGVLRINLADGSIVSLQPNSKVSFPTQFNNGEKREVFLSGEAFFEVTKNPNRPFVVYANELITKVIGTSFTIKAFPKDKEVTVNVKTGQVSVSVAKQATNPQTVSQRELEGIVLFPNQKAVLSRQDVRLVKSLVENPALIAIETPAHKPIRGSFEFDASPASSVFKAIELAYGVDIVFDETLFSTCEFTGNINDESLYEKLDIICKSIEAKYQILDAQIIISGKGCDL